MNQVAILILPIFLLALTHSGSAQVDRFIVNIVEYRNSSDQRYLCSATIITNRHVLTTAVCASSQIRSGYSLSVQVESFESIAGGFISGSSTGDVNAVFIHPDYRNGQNKTANIAVIHTSSAFRGATHYPQLGEPRIWGSLSNSTNQTCQLYGSGGANVIAQFTDVKVQPPQFCDPSFPQVFCSDFAFLTNSSCSAYQGSPVVCANGTVNGFVINENGCVLNGDGRVMLSYHSVGNFSEWIREVSGAEKTVKTSLLVLSAVLLLFKNLM